ncbi:hypothetical protein J6590_014542 [Homalodisca vitripennis]|nr:hypothetical protein J6590_014542 [Homalodisca vitripennis]
MPSGICNGRTEVTETISKRRTACSYHYNIRVVAGILGITMQHQQEWPPVGSNQYNSGNCVLGVSSTAKGKERRYSMFAMSITVLPTRNVTISDLIPTGPAQISMWSRARIW